jgi:hypothetical protein
MPALSVSIDGVAIATMNTKGFDVLNVRLAGTHVDKDFPMLDVTAGSYPEEGESSYLIWVSQLPLRPSQVLEVSFLEDALSSHQGKTVEQIFQDEEHSAPADFKVPAEIFAELRAMPKLHEKFFFRLASSSGVVFSGGTASDEHGFGFSVLWNSFQPERPRVSLHSYTLDALESRGPMNYHVEESMQYGDSVRFELVDYPSVSGTVFPCRLQSPP